MMARKRDIPENIIGILGCSMTVCMYSCTCGSGPHTGLISWIVFLFSEAKTSNPKHGGICMSLYE